MAGIRMFLTFLFLSWLTNSSRLAFGSGDNYVEDACNVTLHQDICVRTLASFTRTCKRSPSKWARAGVSVTIGEVKSVVQYLKKLKQYQLMKGVSRGALSDCIECFQAANDELHQSLYVLRKLSKRKFDLQMGDLKTWISAALTNEDTCSDGFDGQKGNQVKKLQSRVLNATYITSNALALVTKLATTGLEIAQPIHGPMVHSSIIQRTRST